MPEDPTVPPATDATPAKASGGRSPRAKATATGTLAERKLGGSSIAFALIFYGAIGLFWIWNSESARRIATENLVPISVVGGVLVVVLLIAWTRRDQAAATDTPGRRRIVFTTFFALPILGLLAFALYRLDAPFQIMLLRSMFLLIVCVIPALMYFLFIASRKTSLLQEYFSSLSRLGLLEAQELEVSDDGRVRYESEAERKVRLTSYLRKFEAVYGPLSPEGVMWFFTPPDAPSTDDTSESTSLAAGDGGSALGSMLTPETATPVVLATLLIGLGWLVTLPPWEIVSFAENTTTVEKLRHVLLPGQMTIAYAFLGAYFFSLQMLLRRYVRKDLRPNAYMAVSVRVLLAVIGTWVVTAAFGFVKSADDVNGAEIDALLIMGFVVGAFPPVAWQVVQAAFRKITLSKFFVPSLDTAMPVSDLDGLTVWHQARLEEEDIENVPNMATADVVELLLNTRFPADRIVDWIDQALLYTYLGPDADSDETSGENPAKSSRDRLRDHGIRAASALIAAYDGSRTRGDQAEFEKILGGEGRSRIRSLVDTLRTNSTLHLIQRWRQRGGEAGVGSVVTSLVGSGKPADAGDLPGVSAPQPAGG